MKKQVAIKINPNPDPNPNPNPDPDPNPRNLLKFGSNLTGTGRWTGTE